MSENQEHGVTRRELLRRGAALGGAVVWATPVVQTLGMGRAFAQTASPVGKDISYIVIQWDCPNEDPKHTKWENGSWQAGATPDCDLSSTPASSPVGITIDSVVGACANITVSSAFENCTVKAFLKAGSSSSTDDPCQENDLQVGTNEVCTI